MQPRVSIVTPTLNAARFVPELLRCIEHQQYPNIDHVVVDGGSTDGTVDILRAARSGPRLMSTPGSMYAALNYGMQRSDGSIIGWLNADDMFFPDTIAKVVEFFERHPDVDIVYGDVLTIFMASQSFDFSPMPNEYADRWGDVLVYLTQPAAFMRRLVMDRIGMFDPDLKAAGDFDYWYRAFRGGARFKRLPLLLAIVRYHGSNLSLTPRWYEELEAIKARYLGTGLRMRMAERYRRLRRKVLVNRFTVPLFCRGREPYLRLDRRAYFHYVLWRRTSPTPILVVDLPYFHFEAIRALNFDGGHAVVATD